MGTLGFSISDFKSNMDQRGVVRSHSYMILINPPPALQSYDAAQLTLRCDSINMPGYNLMTQDGLYRYGYGPAEVMPYNVAFTPVTASFIIDRAASQYTFFNLWMNEIFDMDMQGGIVRNDPTVVPDRPQGPQPYEVGYKDNYSTTMNLFVYNETTDRVIELTFQETYPVLMQDTMLSWADVGNVIRIQMTFAYKTFYMKTIERLADDITLPTEVRRALSTPTGPNSLPLQPAVYYPRQRDPFNTPPTFT